MTDRNDLRALKAIAKRRARAHRIALSKALDAIASALGLPHWNALTTAWEKGWRPTSAQLEAVRGPCDQKASPRQIRHIQEGSGEIDGEPYELEVDFDSVLIGGNGWAIHVGHAPSEKAQIERYVTPNPLDDPAFFKEVMKIANAAADRVRESICQGWPRRSTKPDRAGRTMHPLFRGISAEWFCAHCDTKSTGEQMAANMWHCPKCSATPLDIHPAPFWRECLQNA
jgi:hypothetical protein